MTTKFILCLQNKLHYSPFSLSKNAAISVSVVDRFPIKAQPLSSDLFKVLALESKKSINSMSHTADKLLAIYRSFAKQINC